MKKKAKNVRATQRATTPRNMKILLEHLDSELIIERIDELKKNGATMRDIVNALEDPYVIEYAELLLEKDANPDELLTRMFQILEDDKDDFSEELLLVRTIAEVMELMKDGEDIPVEIKIVFDDGDSDEDSGSEDSDEAPDSGDSDEAESSDALRKKLLSLLLLGDVDEMEPLDVLEHLEELLEHEVDVEKIVDMLPSSLVERKLDVLLEHEAAPKKLMKIIGKDGVGRNVEIFLKYEVNVDVLMKEMRKEDILIHLDELVNHGADIEKIAELLS